ncbi:MAG: glycosyltransferase family 39 protein [SAR324 cluster bacterium]|nr:glycosyltransferase family 39 protein [SAR324 cluster bacterium]
MAREIFQGNFNAEDQLHLRFGVWVFNWIAFQLLGVSEFSFFLPTVLMSASFSVIGYFVLVSKKTPRHYAFLAGLAIASAPFEILTGTLRANDLILSWLLAIGFALLIRFEKRPVLQGISVSFFLWFGFHVKLWVVYLVPVLALYFLLQIVQKNWKGFCSFAAFSALLHGITMIVMREITGFFMPFLHAHAATYPVPAHDLPILFLMYPKYLFQGEEFGNTLFGSIPFLLIFGLGIKFYFSTLKSNTKRRLDRLDYCLLCYYGTFFLFINFFPNSFVFDQYYSAPRIFRYLSPLSFPMTLHLVKLVLDIFHCRKVQWRLASFMPALILMGISAVNLLQAHHSTAPGRTYHQTVKKVSQEIADAAPPRLLVEVWLSFFMENFYLKEANSRIEVFPILNTSHVSEYENWLSLNQSKQPKGTMLLTGLGSCVHYNVTYKGFQLTQFQNPLHASWKMFKEFNVLDYLPYPEPARLWVLSEKIESK